MLTLANSRLVQISSDVCHSAEIMQLSTTTTKTLNPREEMHLIVKHVADTQVILQVM